MTLNTRIAPALARALEKKGFASLTEVQEAVLAPDADGADLLVSAQTGSGKTVAFGIAIASSILEAGESFAGAGAPLALIVAPTRELALQVQREFQWLYGEARGRIASCVGGMDARTERRALDAGCHIVVGTPGRLRDHIERGALDMSALRAVVLDEADEMLDFGFREDLEYILDASPAARRTLLFSATVPRAISDIARRYQREAVRISTVSEREQHADIEYKAMPVAPSDRENAIINVLRYYDASRALVFCSTREAVNRLSSRFGNRGFAVVALSGELSQNERTHALQALRDGRAKVCIATDVAARGIDLPGLELVIHADLPTNGDTLKHRSGRTGRAGQKGVCCLIVSHTQRGRAQRLLRDARVEAEWTQAPSLQDIRERDRERMLANPALLQDYDAETLADAGELLARHSPEQIAAAFLGLLQAATPSAEELLDAPMDRSDKPRVQRDAFTDGVWFRLSAGRKQRAEPRWLLPIICRTGHVTKVDVGSIEIGETESRFEISGAAAERFMAAVLASDGGEKGIRITRETGKHEAISRQPAAKPPHRPRPQAPSNKPAWKPRDRAPAAAAGDAPTRKKWEKRSPEAGRTAAETRSPQRREAKPRSNWDPARPSPVASRPESGGSGSASEPSYTLKRIKKKPRHRDS